MTTTALILSTISLITALFKIRSLSRELNRERDLGEKAAWDYYDAHCVVLHFVDGDEEEAAQWESTGRRLQV